MTTVAFSRYSRAVAAAGASVALTLGLAGCSGAVPKDDVAAQIRVELDRSGVPTGAVSCPQDLKAEVGQTLRCTFETDGQPVDAVATITSIEGDLARYDVTAEARPVPRELLQRRIGEAVGQETGATIDSTDCSADLLPTVGEAVTCTVNSGTESVPITVTVTTVDGGEVDYSFERA